MAKAVTEEQVELRRRARRRLVGAIALVTVIAVVLPWVLDSEPQTAAPDVSVQIPSPNAGAFTSKVVPLDPAKSAPAQKPVAPDKAAEEKTESPGRAGTDKGQPVAKPAPDKKDAGKPAAQVPAAQAPKPPPAGPETLETEQQRQLSAPVRSSVRPPEKAAKSEKGDKPAPATAGDVPSPATPVPAKPRAPDEPAKAAKTDRGFVVQVTALADVDKARALQQDLAGKGLPVYTEVVQASSGPVTRVRVGPFPTREAAERAREQLKAQGHGGNVVPR